MVKKEYGSNIALNSVTEKNSNVCYACSGSETLYKLLSTLLYDVCYLLWLNLVSCTVNEAILEQHRLLLEA